MRAISILLLTLAALLAACSGSDSETTEDPDSSSASAASQANSGGDSVAQFEPSSQTLPTRPVEFTVQLPQDTVAPVRLRVLGLHTFDTVRDVELTFDHSNTWSATVDLEQGALIRYRYERADEDTLEAFTTRVEAQHNDLEMTWRLLAVTDDLSEVRDTVAMWADQRAPRATGTITGIVTTATGGTPLHNVEVSAGGFHSATGIEGEFALRELTPGDHMLTLHRADGSVFARSIPITVTAGAETSVEPVIEEAAPVEVTFHIAMPADRPDGAHASLFGTAQQLGGWFGQAPNQIESLTQPVLGPADGEVTYTARLFEGQHVLYRYNLGMVGVNGERSQSGVVLRQFIVSAAEPERRDVIEAWRLDGLVFTTVHVSVPDNTPEGPPPLVAMGPSHPLTPRADGSYQATLVSWPGSTWDFSYILGGQLRDLEPAPRLITSGETDQVIEHVVTGWEGIPARARLQEGASTEVLIRLSVSAADEGVPLHLIGDESLQGVTLVPLPDNPSILEARVRMPAGRWAYTVAGCPNIHGADTASTLQLTVDHERPVIDLWSVGCENDPLVTARELDYITGIYTPDLFSQDMPRLTNSTYQSIVDAGGGAVALSSVLAYGRTLPSPTLERRHGFASSVMTPTWALRYQAESATEHTLTTFLAPQFNFELTPGGSEGLSGARDATWWDAWLGIARSVWLEHAILANELGSDLLLLPGPFFHAFGPSDDLGDQAALDAFNEDLATLIVEVREHYDGQILMAGSNPAYTFLADIDIAGVTGFGLDHPKLPSTASLADWEAAYERQFQARIDPVRTNWGKPVAFYQLHIPAPATEGDPAGEYQQAKQLEALMRAIERRPWIVGSFSWGWGMTEAPQLPDGLRGRLGEAVQAKFFARLTADQSSPSATAVR